MELFEAINFEYLRFLELINSNNIYCFRLCIIVVVSATNLIDSLICQCIFYSRKNFNFFQCIFCSVVGLFSNLMLWDFFLGKFLFTCLCRLHSAGHLLDVCMKKVGLGHLEPGKGYHFPDGYVNFVVDSVRWVGL